MTVELAMNLGSYAYDTGYGRFKTTIQRRYEDLSEPTKLELTSDDPELPDLRLVWEVVSPDSSTVLINDGTSSNRYAMVSTEHFDALRAASNRRLSIALTHAIDSLAQGVGLTRRGIFRSYTCGDECAVFTQ